MKHWLLAFLLAIIIAPVSASEPFCAVSTDEVELYLYPDYKRGENGSFLIWVRTDLKKPREGMENVAYMMDYREYSADLDKHRNLQSIDYDKNNRIIWKDEPDKPKWHYNVPGSIGEKLKTEIQKLILSR